MRRWRLVKVPKVTDAFRRTLQPRSEALSDDAQLACALTGRGHVAMRRNSKAKRGATSERLTRFLDGARILCFRKGPIVMEGNADEY
jgi:hypothetical protein